MKLRIATGLIRRYMVLCGFRGWTSYWGTVYVLAGSEKDKELLAHEQCHLDQMRHDGRIVFTIKYLYWLARFGYWDNPYEVRARQAGKDALYGTGK